VKLFFTGDDYPAELRRDIASLKLQNDAVLAALTTLLNQGKTNMADLTSLTAQVAKNTTVVGSAVTLIQGFAAQLAAAGTDPVKLAALQQSLSDSDDALANAVAANTPAATPAG
jgi:hypothetical protein